MTNNFLYLFSIKTRAVLPVATCGQSPYLHRQDSYCHCDVIFIITSRAYGARSPRSHYDAIPIVTSLTTELATPTVTDVRYGHLTAFNI